MPLEDHLYRLSHFDLGQKWPHEIRGDQKQGLLDQLNQDANIGYRALKATDLVAANNCVGVDRAATRDFLPLRIAR
jgi:hypothetical protein